jgi:PAS domain S-box-containing protein
MSVISLPFVVDESSVSGFDRVGSFSYLSEPDRWEWSDAVARMHGYEPGTVTPTTQLILSHKHPDDQPAVSEIIDQVLCHGAAFSSRHRIIDTAGNEHVVVVVGDRLLDAAERVIGTTGFYVDLTEHFTADVQRSVTEAVAAVEERRALIQQAIGMIRMAYGVSAERAFEVLKWRSQQTNVKLRVIAEHIVEQLVDHPPASEVRSHIDHVLLTAHERSGGSPLEP